MLDSRRKRGRGKTLAKDKARKTESKTDFPGKIIRDVIVSRSVLYIYMYHTFYFQARHKRPRLGTAKERIKP
jgi:hypothetical protein